MSNSSLCIPSNPDITGIGVRTAIYAQNLLSFFPAVFTILDKKVSPSELEALENQSTTILITAFAILLSAIVQAVSLGLTNYHAMIVLNLSWINNTNTFIYFVLYFHRRARLRFEPLDDEKPKLDSNGRHTWVNEMKEGLINPVLLIGSLHLSLMAGVGIWLWSNPSTFSNSESFVSHCQTPASIVVLGHGIPLVSKGLQIWSILIYSVLLIPVLNLAVPVALFLTSFFAYHYINPRSSGLGRSVTPIVVGLTLLFSINIVFVADTETTISRNSNLLQKGDQAWTFGQTLALLLLLVPLRDLCVTILERRPKQLAKKLLEGAGKGQLDVVKYVVELGADINYTDPKRDTPLLRAAYNGQWTVVEFLVDKGADIDARDSKEWTALFHAADKGGSDVLALLLQKTADINVKDHNGWTALSLAASKGHLKVARHLLDNGADIYDKDWNGRTALFHAAESGHLDVVKLLIKRRAIVNHRNWHQQTALYGAAIGGHSDVVEYLAGKGADVNNKDWKQRTALFYAADKGHIRVVEPLLEKGAQINEQDVNQQTALFYAVDKGSLEIIETLLEKGAAINNRDRNQQTALFNAVEKGYLNVIELLLKRGADINNKDLNQQTVLFHASYNGRLDVVKLLLEKGANVTDKDENQQTAISYAMSRGHQDVVDLLYKYGADEKGVGSL